MIWFLPLLKWGIGGLAAILFTKWVIDYLDKRVLKKHIQEQKKQKYPEDISKFFGGVIEKGLEAGNSKKIDIGLPLGQEDKQIAYDKKDRIKILVEEYGWEEEVLLDFSSEDLEELLLLEQTTSEYDKENVIQYSKDKLIDILVSSYGYEKKWLVNKSEERLQEMLDDLTRNTSKNEVDWVLEDEESRKIFAGKYYNGEVVSMEEIKAKEIDSELQWELDNKEIVIL